MSKIEVDAVEPQSGTALTIGASGDTITIPSGATINNQGTAVNFGATGSASWVTGSIKTATFTATAGEGYFCNTTAGGFTVNLPAGSAGAVVAVKDYAGTFDNNSLIVAPNGSEKIGGVASAATLSAEGIAITLVYLDSTQGWLVTDSGLQSEASQILDAEYLIVAGGGAGGKANAGGGGAGGLLTNFGGTALSLIPGVVYTVTVGAGGAAVSGGARGNNGTNSVLSGSGITTLTAIGGGGGGSDAASGGVGADGGSGGGSDYDSNTGGSGTAGQGNDGGDSNNPSGQYGAGGGGGAGGAGTGGSTSAGGVGGVGLSNSITGSAVFYAGGGGGSTASAGGGAGGNGGGGAGGDGGAGSATDGTDGLGGGGGGIDGGAPSGAGGDGVVILSVADADYSGTTTGSPTVTANAGGTGKTTIKFLASGSYTA